METLFIPVAMFMKLELTKMVKNKKKSIIKINLSKRTIEAIQYLREIKHIKTTKITENNS
jgi:hypothetical protein